jgi:hypothetical protein
MPDPLTSQKRAWPESDVPAGPRAGQAPRKPIIPWYDNTWGGPGAAARPEDRAGFSELPLLVALAILGAGIPPLAILGALALQVLLFAAIGRRPVNAGVIRGLIWLYRLLVIGEAVIWWIAWGSREILLPAYALALLIGWLLVAAGRRVRARARPA